MPHKYLVAIVEKTESGQRLHSKLEETCDIVTYGHEAAALDGMLLKPPDIVLLDVRMEDMEITISAMASMRSHASLSQVPVIAFAENARLRDRNELLSMGFTDYISTRIFNFEAGVRLIEAHIAGRYRTRGAT